VHHPRGFSRVPGSTRTFRVHRLEGRGQCGDAQPRSTPVEAHCGSAAPAGVPGCGRGVSRTPGKWIGGVCGAQRRSQPLPRPSRATACQGRAVILVLQECWLLPRNLAIAFMLAYRRFISPLYGQVCRYYPSCSRYALEVFQRQGFVVGVLLTVWRLLRCNPFSSGGIDDAPERRHPRFSINASGFVRPNTRKA